MSPFRICLVLLVYVGAASGTELPEFFWDEPVDYPGDPIPYSEVMRCVESDGAYEVDGITVSKDTIWVTDPNGISITENTTLEHDYVCVGNGFILAANGIMLDGNAHSIIYSDEVSGYGIIVHNTNHVTIRKCNMCKGNSPSYENVAISVHSTNTIIEYNSIIIDGLGDFGITLTDSGESLIQDNTIVNNGEYAISIALGYNQEYINIVNNQIYSYGSNSISIKIKGSTLYTNISNNYIYAEEIAVYLNGEGSNPENNIIIDNIIESENLDIVLYANIDYILLQDQNIEGYQITYSRVQIEKSEIGQIDFKDKFYANGTSLDSDVLIEDNKLGIDTLIAPDGLITTPAHLVFYSPTIEGYPPYFPMMNGSPCPDSIYSNFQVSGDTLFSFDVTHMALEFSIGGTPNTIEITDPDSASIWYQSAGTRMISWEYGGTPPGGNVSIDLYKDFEHVSTLTAATPNDGSWSFSSELPTGWESGDDYRVLIVDASDDQGWSDEFSIDMETGIETPDDPGSCRLDPVTPNPTGETFTVSYYIPCSMETTIAIYDLTGRLVSTVAEGEQSTGLHQVQVEGIPSGVYFCRLETEADRFSESIVVIR